MFKKTLSLVTSLVVATSIFCTSNASASTKMRSAKEIVSSMGAGWNLGNSLESGSYNNTSVYDFETSWGNIQTTKAMIDEIKKAGFTTVRIPVKWGPHMNSTGDYKVKDEWMNRVNEVVDYCISNDLYTIINVHHDEDWVIPDYNNLNTVTPRLESLWTQIATHFKNYDDKLIFETLNEPRLKNTIYEWNGGTPEYRDIVNKYNQSALTAIRNTGGNNSKRAVMMPTYAASINDDCLNDFVAPNDSNIIVSLHAYIPLNFAMDLPGTSVWGSSSDKSALDTEINKYYNTFVKKGIPVIISEFGSINKNNTDSRVTLAGYFVNAAKKKGIPCIWWDNNHSSANTSESYGIFNRNNLTWTFEEIKNTLIKNSSASIVSPTEPNNSNSSSNSNNSSSSNTVNSGNANNNNNNSSNSSNSNSSSSDNTKSNLSLSSKVDNWGTSYMLNITIKNNSNTDVKRWTLKLKKSEFKFNNYWDVDVREDGEYLIVTPKTWKQVIGANSSITTGLIGVGSANTNFYYEIY